MPAGPLPPRDPDVLNLTETAARLRVSRPWLHDAITTGTFPARKTGRRYFISWRAVLAWVEAGNAPPAGTDAPPTAQLQAAGPEATSARDGPAGGGPDAG